MNETIEIKDGFDHMDFEAVTTLLGRADWGKGITLDRVKKEAKNSAIVVGAFMEGAQIGYARAISDKSSFAYVADVFVDEKARKRGIATQMMRHILNHADFSDVSTWLLHSAADELYEKVGFEHIKEPHRWMKIQIEKTGG